MPELNLDPTKTCCFTGHRPEHIMTNEEELFFQLDTAIRQAHYDGYTTFITGAAKGFDIFAGEYVLHLQKGGLPIRLVCAVPYPNFNTRGKDKWSARCTALLEKASAVEYTCDHYHGGVFQKRNRWMVDHSSRVISYFTGCNGGTKNTIDYALTKNIEIVNLYRDSIPQIYAELRLLKELGITKEELMQEELMQPEND